MTSCKSIRYRVHRTGNTTEKLTFTPILQYYLISLIIHNKLFTTLINNSWGPHQSPVRTRSDSLSLPLSQNSPYVKIQKESRWQTNWPGARFFFRTKTHTHTHTLPIRKARRSNRFSIKPKEWHLIREDRS